MELGDEIRGCCAPTLGSLESRAAKSPQRSESVDHRGQVLVPAGVFAMGDAFDEGYRGDGEIPVHEVELPAFRIDATPVTNAQFSSFVNETGHLTDAEALGVSAVFHLAVDGQRGQQMDTVQGAPWWLIVPEASWHAPEGRGSDVAIRASHPVTHVSWNDAQAYCSWAGKRLPTEAEWERAARGGLAGRRYAWGDELVERGRWRCNIWQGNFPVENTLGDGHLTTAPVRTFEPNGFGLWQVAGNVWEWCSDWFDATYYTRSPQMSPSGPDGGATKVMRGGSYLCHHSYCNRYRVAARSSNTPDSATANLGFRCANDA